MNNGRSFQYTKFSVIDLVFTDKRNNSGKRPKSARGKPSSCRFSFPAARNAIEYEALCFSYRILVPVLLGKLERHRLRAIRIFQCFSNHNPKNIRQTTLNQEWFCRSFINLTKWRERRVTCHQRYRTHVKKYDILSRVLLRLL